MQYGFGVDLGGTTVKIASFSQDGVMLDKWEIPTVTAEKGKQILPDIAAALREYQTDKAWSMSQILGIGIGVPGPVNSAGVVNKCDNLGWDVLDVRKILSHLTELPVYVGNDANLAALGETWKGGGAGCDNMLMVTFGTGVGGGIILNGRPLNGAHGSAGEIGHLVMEPTETEACGCGKRGCAEQYCSATGIVRLAKKHLAAYPGKSPLEQVQTLRCKDVFDAAAAGDASAQQILEQVYEYMGRLLANVCNTLDPEVVVLGGGVSRAGQPLLEGAYRYFQKYVYHGSAETRFAMATLGNDAGVYGAFKLVLDAQR